MRLYAVYDTNVLVSSLLTRHPDAATVQVVDAILNEDIIPLYNREILEEYGDVLRRPRFHFSETRIRTVLNMICQFGAEVYPSPVEETLPDADDLVFYEIVMEKREDGAYLITGNLRHYPRREYIVTPAEMAAILRRKAQR